MGLRRRMLGALLGLAMLLGLLPGVALADDVRVLAEGANTSDAKTVMLGGLRWQVIGYDGEGVAQTAGSGTMTLLLDGGYLSDRAYQSVFNDRDNYTNHYRRSTLKARIAAIGERLSGDELTAIEKRFLEFNGKFGNDCDAVADDLADSFQTLWPLSTKEANALDSALRKAALDSETERMLRKHGDDNAQLRKARERGSDWWLRSPGDLGYRVACVSASGVIVKGYDVTARFGVRPACFVRLRSVASVSEIESGENAGAYELSLSGSQYDRPYYTTDPDLKVTESMSRLYNPNTGEHLYTSDTKEREHLVSLGWQLEGVVWQAPTEGDPVFRLYNPNTGEHHYTMDEEERDALVGLGWDDEGVGWHSDPSKGVAVYREYNSNEPAFNHNCTSDKAEHDYLVSLGWIDEGVAWYGVAAE